MKARNILPYILQRAHLTSQFQTSNSKQFPIWGHTTQLGFCGEPYTTSTMSELNINSTLRMNSGYDMPTLGYGVYQTPMGVAEKLVNHAFKVGYRHVDSAAAYRNEKPCGLAIQNSGIPRSELFFTSKLLPGRLGYEASRRQVDETLRVTGLGYIDLMLIHAPYGGTQARNGAWKALIEAQESGKVRSIGVSNYGVHHLEELEKYMALLETTEGKGKGGVLSVLQIELHPWLAHPDIVEWCKSRGVVLQAYSPIARGERMNDRDLHQLMKKHGKTGAQILLRWSLQMGFSPLPKSEKFGRIEENAALYDFELGVEDMKVLKRDVYEPCQSNWDPTVAPLES